DGVGSLVTLGRWFRRDDWRQGRKELLGPEGILLLCGIEIEMQRAAGILERTYRDVVDSSAKGKERNVLHQFFPPRLRRLAQPVATRHFGIAAQIHLTPGCERAVIAQLALHTQLINAPERRIGGSFYQVSCSARRNQQRLLVTNIGGQKSRRGNLRR